MKAICLQNKRKHREFYTTVHVVQEWRVDEHGKFISVDSHGAALEVVHGPNKLNVWTCATCGCEAKVTG